MSAREWKPGDVAMVNGKLAFVVPRCPNDLHTHGPHWHIVCGGWNGLDTIHPPRRLAVVDYDDREQLASLARHLVQQGAMHGDRGVSHSGLAAALREFADPTPLKPEEPQGLGAVVEDAGQEYVRDGTSVSTPWRRVTTLRINARRDWSDFSANVRVLSSGVERLAEWERELLDEEDL